jgi:3-(3-hydroxy-phenyl)propionate hydroxylase
MAARVIERRPVVVAGAGLTGMVLALDLARRGQRVTLLERGDGVVRGSRTITYAPTTLEIFCTLGCGQRILGEAFCWSTGTEFLGDTKLRSVTHAAAAPERFTGYRSLPQPLVHEVLLAQVKDSALIDLRLECEVADVANEAEGGVRVRAMHAGTDVELRCDYLVAADGAHSAIRKQLGLRLHGDRGETFLGCDLDTAEPLATDRTVWYDPPFADGRSALLLKYGERKYRLDVHLPGGERQSLDERAVRDVVRGAFGPTLEYRLDYWTTYQFCCQMLSEFQHGSVFFIGDAAHLVPPFGARGGNSGVADAFNLSWKLAGVLQGRYARDLLLTYGTEMQEAARQNLHEAGKTMRFLVPATPLDRAIRNAALGLCRRDPLALRIVNSGSMSRPGHYGRQTQVHLTAPERTACVVPTLQKVPNFLMRWSGEPVYLHDRLGKEFSTVVLSRAEGPGLRQERRLKAELAEFGAMVSTLVVVQSEPSERRCPSVIWDEHGVLKAYLGGRDHGVLLIRPDRYLLGLASFLGTDSVKTLLRAMGPP